MGGDRSAGGALLRAHARRPRGGAARSSAALARHAHPRVPLVDATRLAAHRIRCLERRAIVRLTSRLRAPRLVVALARRRARRGDHVVATAVGAAAGADLGVLANRAVLVGGACVGNGPVRQSRSGLGPRIGGGRRRWRAAPRHRPLRAPHQKAESQDGTQHGNSHGRRRRDPGVNRSDGSPTGLRP